MRFLDGRPEGLRNAQRLLIFLALTLTVLASQASTTRAHQSQTAALTVAGDVATPLALAAADLKGRPRTRVEVKEDGKALVYEGVLAGEILKRAGVPLGADLRGPAVATYVLASAPDGYHVVFSLAELDPGFTSNDIIVADPRRQAARCVALRIVAPKDTRRSRSIRMLQRLEVVRLRK